MIEAPFDRERFERAIVEWFGGATGVPLIWANQTIPQLAHAYATASIQAQSSIGGEDETRVALADPPGDPGEEIEILAAQLRRLTVSFNVFSNSNAPSSDARAIMDKARAGLFLPSVARELQNAGIAVISDGAILNLDQLEADAWIGRAQMDVIFCAAFNARDRVGYIETAEVTAPELGWNPQTFEVVD